MRGPVMEYWLRALRAAVGIFCSIGAVAFSVALAQVPTERAGDVAVRRDVSAVGVDLSTSDGIHAAFERYQRLTDNTTANNASDPQQLRLALWSWIARTAGPDMNYAEARPYAAEIAAYAERLPPGNNNSLAALMQHPLIRLATRETLRAVVNRFARATERSEQATTLLELEGIPAGAPLDFEALQAAFTTPPQEGERRMLNAIAIRLNHGQSPWRLQPESIGRAECEASRELPANDQRACFGIVHLRHEMLEACLAYAPDLVRSCVGSAHETPDNSPLRLAIAARDEFAIVHLLDHGASARGVGAINGLVKSAPGLLRTVVCEKGHSVCPVTEDLPWLRRMMELLKEHGASVDEAGHEDQPPFMDLVLRLNPPFSSGISSSNGAINEINRQLAAALLDAGADVNATVDQCTALDYATYGAAPKNLPGTGSPNTVAVDFLAAHGGRRTIACSVKHAAATALRAITPSFSLGGH